FRGLLALILLTRGRSGGRLDDDGAQVVLAEVDRSPWDRAMIDQGLAQLQAAVAASVDGAYGPMTLQAAIAAEHALVPSLEATDWRRVVHLYGALLRLEPSPTIAVGRCVAMAHLTGWAGGLADLDEVIALG